MNLHVSPVWPISADKTSRVPLVGVRGERPQHQWAEFMLDNTTYREVFPTADTKTKARELEEEEKRKVRLSDRPISDDFKEFVDTVYLKYSKENKASYVHDQFRCKMLCDYFAGKVFKQITSITVVRFIKDRLASKTCRGRPRSPVTVHKDVTLLSSIFPSERGLPPRTNAPKFRRRYVN